MSGGDLTIWKNGGFFASRSYWQSWFTTGAWTVDSGSQTVEFAADGYDYQDESMAFSYAWVTVQGNASNNPPTASVACDQQVHGATVVRPYGGSVQVTLRFQASDPDGNLSGIRPQIWHPASGYFENDGGAWTGQSGGSGEVVRTVTLNQDGDWYFWTDAEDASGEFVNSGAWTSGFRLTVIQSNPPPQAPSVYLFQPSADLSVPVGTTITLQAYAEDFSRSLAAHNIDIQRPDGSWNWQGSFAFGEPFMGGPVGPDAPTSSLRTVGFTLNQVGTWKVRSYAANNANLNAWTTERTITVTPLSQSVVSISPTSASITLGQSVTFTAAGGSGTGAYLWTGALTGTGTSVSLTPTATGSYTVTLLRQGDATYADSSPVSATVQVGAASQAAVTISPAQTSIEVGQSVAFTAAGGSGSGSYTWGGDASGTGANKTVVFNTSGTRQVTVHRAASSGYLISNTATATITVNGPANQFISVHPQSQTAVTGATVSFTVTPAGTGPFTYQWKKNGVAIAGQTGVSLTLPNLQVADAAGYAVQVTSPAGTALSNIAWLPIVDASGGGNASSPSAAQKSPVAPGLVSTMVGGSGYDIATGSIHRVVRDFQVAGSVGAYPLEMTRTFTGSNWGYSFVWSAEELANPQFIQNQGFPPLAQQFINVRTPDGQILNFVANPTDYPTQFCQSFDGVRVAVVRENNQRVAAIALHFADGGYLMMEKAVDTGDRRRFRPILLVDPFGLRTTYTYSGANSLLPYQVTDATGRYLRFTGTSETDVQRVESSDNKSIQWTGSTLNYWDGLTASFTTGTTSTGLRYYRFSDVRQMSPMRNVEYILEKVNYGPSSEPLTTNTYLWEVVRERHFTSTDALDSGMLVSTRTVHERKQAFEEQSGISATGPAVDVSETRGDGAVRNFKFQMSGGKMISATDYRSNRSYFEDWIGNLPSRIRDAKNNSTNVESSGWGQISKITHPLTEVAPFLDGTEGTQTVRDYREYQWTGRFLTGQRDERGNWTYFDRDGQNRIWRIRYADTSYEQFYYNSLNQLEKRRLRNGAFEYWEYYTDTKLPYRYWPANEANPGNVTSQPYFEYTYYATGPQKGLMLTSRDPRGKVTTFEYFDSGLLKKEIFHDTTFRSYTYDNWGNRLTATDESSNVTTWTYDAYNRVQTVKDPTNDITTHNYTPSRNDTLSPLVHVASVIRRTTQPSGLKTAFKHNDDYHITEEIRGEGSAEEAKSIMDYDEVGNLTKRTDQVKMVSGAMQTRVTDFAYDARNRKRTEFAPLARTTKWKYDAASNVIKVINPDNTATTKTYNAMNQLATSADEMGDTTEYRYYPSGLLWKIIDPRLKEYVHTYDAVGRIKSRTYPDTAATQEKWDYDAAGNVEFYYNRSNKKQTYTYDDRNRESTRAWDDAAAPAVKTTYHANGLVWIRANGTMTPGNPATFAATISTLTNTYHADGALHTQRQAPAAGPSAVTVTYTYDTDGRRQTFSGGTGRTLGYLYNARGGLAFVRNGGLTGSNLASFTYNLAEQRLTRTAGNNVVTTYDYDGAGRLNLINAAGVLRLDFGHDVRDRRKWTKRDSLYGDTYTYQADSELDVYRHHILNPDNPGTNAPTYSTAFLFDDSGNRTSVQRTGQGASSTLYAAGHDNRYDTVNVNGASAPIAHDARGNVTTWDGKTFTYDADNRLRTASGPGLTMTLDYDGDGRLVKLVKNGTAEYRFYDGAQCFLRTDANGAQLDWTVWGPTPDEVLARQTSTGWDYYHQDPINSVQAVTNASGTVRERYLYDVFGLPDVRDANWNARASTAIDNPWLFTGQEWRADLGLANYKARWYQPTLGRFMQNDPVRFDAGDINLYRYCGNNPVNQTDPSGQFVAQVVGAAVGAVINAYQNYDAYKSGKMDGFAYATSIATGAGYGALATVAPTVVGAALLGGTAAALNSATNDALSGNEAINVEAAVTAGVVGAGTGAAAAGAAKLAGVIDTTSEPIGRVVGEGRAIPDLAAKVGITADAVGNVAAAAVQDQSNEKIPTVKTDKTPAPAKDAPVEFKLDFKNKK